MFAAVLTMDLHLPQVDSLKAKRAAITPILAGARRRYEVAAAEVAQQDHLGSARVSFAAVSGTLTMVTEILDAVERFVWSFPEVEVSHRWRNWIDNEEDR